MVHLPTISNSAVSTGPRQSGHLGGEKKQANCQMTLSFTGQPTVRGTFPPAVLCTFCGGESLLHEVCLAVSAHFLVPDYWALQKGREVKFQRPPWVSDDLFRCFCYLWCFLFTCMPWCWGFPSLWFARRVRKTQFRDKYHHRRLVRRHFPSLHSFGTKEIVKLVICSPKRLKI